jgi:hypothetical protein
MGKSDAVQSACIQDTLSGSGASSAVDWPGLIPLAGDTHGPVYINGPMCTGPKRGVTSQRDSRFAALLSKQHIHPPLPSKSSRLSLAGSHKSAPAVILISTISHHGLRIRTESFALSFLRTLPSREPSWQAGRAPTPNCTSGSSPCKMPPCGLAVLLSGWCMHSCIKQTVDCGVAEGTKLIDIAVSLFKFQMVIDDDDDGGSSPRKFVVEVNE